MQANTTTHQGQRLTTTDNEKLFNIILHGYQTNSQITNKYDITLFQRLGVTKEGLQRVSFFYKKKGLLSRTMSN